MKQLWAPWRIDYILSDKENGCLFCRAFSEDRDKANLVLLRGRACLCMLNRYPYNSGHLMVAPRTHCARLAELPRNELVEMLEMSQGLEQLLTRVMAPDGFNIGMNIGRTAGAGIDDHLHLHIVPRWNGDTNFMPVLDDTRVVPQALDALYDSLLAALESKE